MFKEKNKALSAWNKDDSWILLFVIKGILLFETAYFSS